MIYESLQQNDIKSKKKQQGLTSRSSGTRQKAAAPLAFCYTQEKIKGAEGCNMLVFIRDFAVSAGIGAILLLLLSKLIGRVQFSLSTAFWCSVIGQIFLSIIGAITGYLFYRNLGVGLLISVTIGCFLQAVLFQIAARSKNENLARWRAIVLSLTVILSNFFVASPIIEFFFG